MVNYSDIVINIGDRVKVKDLGIRGRVCGIYISSSEVSYKVRYFFDNKPQEVYFVADELEVITDIDNHHRLPFNNAK